MAEAVRLQLQGVKAGVPDYLLPVARGVYHGLFIELKHENGKVSRAQQEFMAALLNEGYYVEVAYSWEEAKNIIERYLNESYTRVIRAKRG